MAEDATIKTDSIFLPYIILELKAASNKQLHQIKITDFPIKYLIVAKISLKSTLFCCHYGASDSSYSFKSARSIVLLPPLRSSKSQIRDYLKCLSEVKGQRTRRYIDRVKGQIRAYEGLLENNNESENIPKV